MDESEVMSSPSENSPAFSDSSLEQDIKEMKGQLKKINQEIQMKMLYNLNLMEEVHGLIDVANHKKSIADFRNLKNELDQQDEKLRKQQEALDAHIRASHLYDGFFTTRSHCMLSLLKKIWDNLNRWTKEIVTRKTQEDPCYIFQNIITVNEVIGQQRYNVHAREVVSYVQDKFTARYQTDMKITTFAATLRELVEPREHLATNVFESIKNIVLQAKIILDIKRTAETRALVDMGADWVLLKEVIMLAADKRAQEIQENFWIEKQTLQQIASLQH